MSLSSVYFRIVSLSPAIEVFLRKIYWKNVSFLYKYRPNRSHVVKEKSATKADFTMVLNFLKKHGVGKGSLIIVHSSYDALASTGLSPNQVIDALLELIGPEGTLAMPVIRHFKEDPVPEMILKTTTDSTVFTYDVKKTKVISGLLPLVLMKRKGSVTSRFPLNPMTAIGPLAVPMMADNLEGENLSPHGEHSSWKFCAEHNATIIGLGLNSGFLTISHVFEETDPDWPVKNWYRKRHFKIIDGDFQVEKTVNERLPKWGLLSFAEINNRNDLVENNILTEDTTMDIPVCIVESRKLLDLFKNRNITNPGYPYHFKKSELK